MNHASFAIHVDCDNSWIQEEEFSTKLPFTYDYLYKVALPRFLDLFDKYNIKASFFIVGKDLAMESCQKFCVDALQKGHKLANHSFSHPVNFGRLSSEERSLEITRCHEEIKKYTGFSCLGFRSPGYGMNNTDILILEKLGYLYDSSVLPGVTSMLIKITTFTKSASYRNKSLNVWKNFFASSNAKKISGKIWQIPIASFPYLRLPVHASLAFMLGEAYISVALWFLHRTRRHNIMLLHALDIADSIPRNNSGINTPIMEKTLGYREEILNKICNSIASKAILTEEFFK